MTLEELYTYQPRVLKFIKKKCENCHDAEDIVQDAFIRSINHLDKITENKAYSWLCTVSVNLWKDTLLSKKPLKRGIRDNKKNQYLDKDTENTVYNQDATLLEDSESKTDFIDIKKMDFQFSDEVINILKTCTQLERDIFEYRYLHGYQYPDIEKVLKIKPWQVKSSLHNIKLKLKESWKF